MQSRMVIVSALVSLLLLIVILLSTNWSNVEDYAHKYGVGSWFLSTSTSHSDTRFAFATYLSGFNETSWEAGYKGGGDQYYDSARIMIYQLLHSPSTRSNPRLPFIALVAADVTEEKRHQLEADGATVIEGAYLTPEWVSRGVGDPRWKNVMVKLNLAAMTEYEKICFIDADTMVYERMDGIFKDPSTRISRTKKQTDQTRDDEAPLPKRYMFAGVPDRGTNHSIPPTQDDYKYLNAGFFCLHPSHEIFDYYISVINIENRFFPVYPEQNMVRAVSSSSRLLLGFVLTQNSPV